MRVSPSRKSALPVKFDGYGNGCYGDRQYRSNIKRLLILASPPAVTPAPVVSISPRVLFTKESTSSTVHQRTDGVSQLEALRNGQPLDATLGRTGFGTGVQNVNSDNSSKTTIHAPIEQHFHTPPGVTPDQMALHGSNAEAGDNGSPIRLLNC